MKHFPLNMNKNSFFTSFLLLVSILLFVSCDKDYNAIGDDLIGENHFDFVKNTSNVVAYNQKITPIQSDDLPINALGIYNNPAFGKTTANFATQIVLSTPNPTIGTNVAIKNVILSVPYFSTLKTTNTDGSHVYKLDSIYGASLAKIKLSVFESGYRMQENEANGFTPQKYYTNQNTDFDNFKVGNQLNDSTDVAQNDSFFFNPAEHVIKTKDATTSVETTTYAVPSMQLSLNKSFFKTKILDATASGKLLTNDVFKEYFKGLYFKVENAGSDPGSLAMLNFAKGTITINYKEDLAATTTGGAVTRVDKSIILNLTGRTVSLLEQTNTNTAYTTATSSANTTLGDERLYLKGGEGSMSVIELFDKTDLKGYDKDGNLTGPNLVSDALDDIRKNNWLINEANLVFHIDKGAMANSYEPNRIYLYDFTNNRPIIDYFVDGTTGTTAKRNKIVFDGNINKEAVANGRGLTYKIRITNQIRNLVKYKDSTNVKLGIVVTESISIANSNKLKTASTVYPFLSQVPRASVMSPLGTILYGTGPTSTNLPEDKKIKLEIYYTKPN